MTNHVDKMSFSTKEHFSIFSTLFKLCTLITSKFNSSQVSYRMRAGIERELASRGDQRVLRRFGHVERMDEYRMARRVLMAEVSGGRVRGRPRLCWMDGVKLALGNRGMTVEAARQCAKDRKVWRALVHM